MGTITEKTLCDKYIKACELLDWNVRHYTDGSGERRAELETWSPLGENLVLDFSVENFVDEVKEYAADFSADEHAEPLIMNRGNNGIPNSIRELLNDADAIDQMLKKLAEAVQKAADEIEREAEQCLTE